MNKRKFLKTSIIGAIISFFAPKLMAKNNDLTYSHVLTTDEKIAVSKSKKNWPYSSTIKHGCNCYTCVYLKAFNNAAERKKSRLI